ncbi:MAG TPA: tetratricopeptide repeat protein [Chitinophagaceae bacterium]|nr:tetratricopeptide repeat protein [Chitinophagaceae bacterium]
MLIKKFLVLALCVPALLVSRAQGDSPANPQQKARDYMRQGDFDNAILVLNNALLQDNSNLEMQKDLALAYYYKRDYAKALDVVKKIVDRDDADVVTFQIAGNVYKALEMVKDCERAYKRGLKKFPRSGPLFSEYGELLWEKKDYSAINLWEEGIRVDPGYAGNYYNAALYYFFTKDKVWSLVYGEAFVNMESLTDRAAAMKQMLLDAYKQKLFADGDLQQEADRTKNEFAKAFLQCMARQQSLAAGGIHTETLIQIRTRFLLDWFDRYAAKFPFKLFDFEHQLLQQGLFEAYNQWLFGSVEDLAAYDNWNKTHAEVYTQFTNFQRTRVFRIPAGQYYQAK